MNRRRFVVGLGATALSLSLPVELRAATPQRIVCAGGAMTEIVFALGAGDSLVAVDTTSIYPWKQVEKLPKIGYLRTLSAEGILSTKPDLILADVDAGPQDVLNLLTGMGAPVAHFTAEHTADSVMPKIRFIGDAIGRAAKAGGIAGDFASDMAAVDAAVARLDKKPSVLFVMNAGATGLRGAGRGTAAGEMITRAGGRNCFDMVTGYKPVSAEAGLAADPDYILMMRQSLDELGGIDNVAVLPALAKLGAAKAKRIVAMGAAYLLAFGPRTAHAARDLAAALHPDAALPALPARAWTAQ